MTQFLDGPAAGVVLHLKRAPVYLRAVCDPRGKWDALDQLEDTPRSDERIVVYEMVGEPSWMHVCGKGRSGVFRGGQYRVVEPQPADDVLRSPTAWRRWVGEKVGQPINEDGTVTP